MTRSFLFACLLTLTIVAAALPEPARAQGAAPLAGVWTLDRSQSEFPADIGFNPAWVSAALPADGAGTASPARGRGGRGSGGGGGDRGAASPFSGRPESYDDARRLKLLNDEARNPAARLTILDTPAAVTMTNELGQSRTFHPDGRKDSIEIQGVPVAVTAQRDGDTLVILYHVEQGRELRYTYSHTASPPALAVDLQFLERGSGDKARRIYHPGLETKTMTPSSAGAGSASPDRKPAEAFDQRPGAELRGLTSLGVLVEDLSATAIACGLNHDAIESALAKRLTDGGFSVRRNADDDTYVYVNIMTNRLGDASCVSRYDAFLYTHATATLSYHDQPVLVQASLMHRGGIGSSVPAAHAAAVTRGLQDYVDVFITQIRDANK